MIVIERMTQKVRPDKWGELEELDKKYTTLEKNFGFPSKKRYQCIVGGHDFNTLIIERQWKSMAELETAYEKALANQEYQKLNQESPSIIKSSQMEFFTPLP